MKFGTAKDSYIRKTTWTKVKFSENNKAKRYEKMKWCRANGTINGKYYWHYAGGFWWFENEDDATLFVLRWI